MQNYIDLQEEEYQMANNFGRSIESRKSKITDIRSDMETKKGNIEKIEDRYSQAMDARMQLENLSDQMDDDILSELRSESATKLESIQEEGEKAADDLATENSKLDEVRVENQEAQAANEKGRSAARVMDSVAGTDFEGKIDSKNTEIESVFEEISNAQKEIDTLSNRARNLSWKHGG